jgi:hypothetical protein
MEEGFEFHVPDTQCIILPSTLGIVAAGNIQEQRRQLLNAVSRVPEDSIVGKALWRLRPWVRFGRLQ